MSEPLTMTTAQVSERYGIKQSTLRQWRRRKMRPHAFRMHGVVLYETAEVEAFIAESKAADTADGAS